MLADLRDGFRGYGFGGRFSLFSRWGVVASVCLEGESGEEGEDFGPGLVEGGGFGGGHLAGDGVYLGEEGIDCRVVSYWRGGESDGITEDSKEVEEDNEEDKWEHFYLWGNGVSSKYQR